MEIQQNKPIWRRILRTGCGRILCGTLLCLVALAGLWLYFWLFHNLPSPEKFADYVDPSISYVPVPLSEVPESLQLAVITVDDPSFYKRPTAPINPSTLLRVIWNVYNCECGKALCCGYTISQGLTKMLLFTSDEQNRIDDCFRNGLRERALLILINRRYTKDEILEFYLNNIPFGDEDTVVYGVEAAAQTYYGKHIHDLSLAESAMLVTWPINLWGSPLNDWESAKHYQERILDLMTEAGYITEAQANRAKEEALTFNQ